MNLLGEFHLLQKIIHNISVAGKLYVSIRKEVKINMIVFMMKNNTWKKKGDMSICRIAKKQQN